MSVVAAMIGALLAVTLFSFVVSRSTGAEIEADGLDRMARSPRLAACADHSDGSQRLQTAGVAVVAGSMQRIEFTNDGGGFDPDIVTARARLPLEIRMRGAGDSPRGMLVEGTKAEPDGPQGYVLPGLEPGFYPFSCSEDHVDGLLIIR